MAEWLDFSVRLGEGWGFLFLVPPLCLFVYWAYKRTRPETNALPRLALTALRSASLVLLLLMLAEPLLELRHKQVRQPLLLVLVDTSASMAVNERGRSRLEGVRQVLGEGDWHAGLAQAQVRAWGFAEEPYPLSLDTLGAVQARGRATNVSRALEESLDEMGRQENLQGILLIADGAHNLGKDPIRLADERDVPVYALGVGSGEHPADVQIAEARIADKGYVNSPLNIEATLKSWGYAGRQVEIRLHDGGEIAERQSLVLQKDTQVQRVSFAVSPPAPGPRVYRVEVRPLEGELSRDNNEALLFTQVLAERIKVLLLAGAPSADLAFLKRSLEADSHLVVRPLVQRAEGTFYQEEAEAVNGSDVVVLLNAGSALLEGPLARAIRDQVGGGAGLLFVSGPKNFHEWDPLSPIAEVMPVSLSETAPFFAFQEVGVALSAEGMEHPVVRWQDGEVEDDPWGELPPLPGYFPVRLKRPGALVLVEGQGPDKPALLVAGSYGQGRVLAALSVSFWRLDLMSSGVHGRPQTIRQFWRNAVNWLATGAPAGRLRVATERHVYRAGEQVVFVAQVFDELLRPQSTASVQIELEEEDAALPLQEQGGGHYLGGWSGLEPGEYAYKALARLGETVIGTGEGHFIVEEYSVEWADVQANPALLGELARVSGGRMYPLEEWRALLESLSPQKKLVQETRTLLLWGPLWPLGVVLMLLGIEWLLRKRYSMISMGEGCKTKEFCLSCKKSFSPFPSHCISLFPLVRPSRSKRCQSR